MYDEGLLFFLPSLIIKGINDKKLEWRWGELVWSIWPRNQTNQCDLNCTASTATWNVTSTLPLFQLQVLSVLIIYYIYTCIHIHLINLYIHLLIFIEMSNSVSYHGFPEHHHHNHHWRQILLWMLEQPAMHVAPDGPSIMLYPRSHWNIIWRPFWIFLQHVLVDYNHLVSPIKLWPWS